VPAPRWPITTERLLLRPFEQDDLTSFHAIHSDEEVVRWLLNDVRSLEETRAVLDRKLAAGGPEGEGDWLSAAVVLRESGELIGDISLHWTGEAHAQGEIGFVFATAHHGKGYATEAARPILDFAFGGLLLHRVVGRLEPRNVGSGRVLEKLGMRREAHFIENEWLKGEWQSEVVYAILAREWYDGSAARSEPGAAPARR
jgi:RimJ/RimL family protein N-acetyltransferase